MKKVLFYFLLLGAIFSSCGQTSEFGYEMADGYFVRNDIPDKEIIEKIMTQPQFNNYFGVAATMSNMPTSIDFSKQFAAVVILPSTFISTEIRVDSMVDRPETLDLYYSVLKGHRQSFSIRPAMVLIVDKTFDRKLNAVENPVVEERQGFVVLEIRDGEASANVGKAKNENVTFVLNSEGYKHIKASITSGDEDANLRFSQIIMPDGSADGPFSRELEYDLTQSGEYRLRVGENMMAGDPWGGTFSVDVLLN